MLEAAYRGIRVQATGFGRVRLDVATALRRIDAVNPQALLFGTDLPGTRAPRPFHASDLDQITQVLGNDALDRLADNGRAWYRVSQPASASEVEAGRCGCAPLNMRPKSHTPKRSARFARAFP